MKVNVKIDQLALSGIGRNDIKFPYIKNLPNYKYIKHIKLYGNEIEKLKDRGQYDYKMGSYKSIVKFKHMKKGTSLIVCHRKRKKSKKASPLYLIFYTDYENTIDAEDVIPIERYFTERREEEESGEYGKGEENAQKELNGVNGESVVNGLKVAEVHVAVDLISDEHRFLFREMKKIVKFGKKVKPRPIKRKGNVKIVSSKKIGRSTKYYGSTKSGNWAILYDKTRQMKEVFKRILRKYVCRVEFRMKPSRMKNFVETLEDLGTYNFGTLIIPKLFSLHRHKALLDEKLAMIGVSSKQPLWKLRDIMRDRFGVTSSNFYVNYLEPHPWSKRIVKGLEEFRWCPDYAKLKNS
jgi:hypothetical protein